MLVQIHLLQNHAPSNLNRDDTGSPKDCLFGGVLRARISSQCLKRSIRQSPLFRVDLSEHLGTRTRGLPKQLGDELRALGCDDPTSALIVKKATAFGSGKESNDEETRQLIFLDPAEVTLLARELKGMYETDGAKKFGDGKIDDIEKRLSKKMPRSVDIALFGRFTTTSAFEDVDSAVQVAHALSTTKVEKQFDYFTAVDDLSVESDERGAGMIGDVEFNSATYYKYFSLSWDKLVENLGGDVEIGYKAIEGFMRAAALTTPTGKQNTFAAHNPPDFVLVEVKSENMPISYANAFVKPVRGTIDKDVMEASIEALGTYAGQIKTAYAIAPVAELYLSVRGQTVGRGTRVEDLATLVTMTTNALKKADTRGAAA